MNIKLCYNEIIEIILLIGVVFIVVAFYKDKKIMKETEMQFFNTDSTSFKVAVISDTQLPPYKTNYKKDDRYVKNLEKALRVIRNNDVDMILFAGDIGDLGTRFAFRLYVNTIDSVFGSNKPIIQTVMGNHDYWSKNIFGFINHAKAFQNITGQSPWTHYVVNGYHFIGASPDNGSMKSGYKITSKWLEQELEKASEDSDGKPIFVMTHNQPIDTCYGSDEWGDVSLNAVLEKYPNVINFSGHSHFSILDERSIWQGRYTVMTTQSLSYTELETGKENGTIPPNADATPMGYIMEFSADSIEIHRINFADRDIGYEEKKDMLWSFSVPYENDGKYAFDTRKADNQAPVIKDTTGNASVHGDKIILSFAAGEDDDFVHSYKVVIDDKDTKYFFSDFYNGIDNMKNTVRLELKNDGVKHHYKIYAVDSWGEESENCITIDNEYE